MPSPERHVNLKRRCTAAVPQTRPIPNQQKTNPKPTNVGMHACMYLCRYCVDLATSFFSCLAPAAEAFPKSHCQFAWFLR